VQACSTIPESIILGSAGFLPRHLDVVFFDSVQVIIIFAIDQHVLRNSETARQSTINFVRGEKGDKSPSRSDNNRSVHSDSSEKLPSAPPWCYTTGRARAPTEAELASLRTALGDDVFSKVQVVSKQTDLFNAVNAALR